MAVKITMKRKELSVQDLAAEIRSLIANRRILSIEDIFLALLPQVGIEGVTPQEITDAMACLRDKENIKIEFGAFVDVCGERGISFFDYSPVHRR